MNSTSPALLNESVTFLIGLAADQADQAVAQSQLQDLRARHPEVRIRLLWQVEEFDSSIHYDLLVTGQDRSTVSLSYCPDHPLPWPLRGGHRVGDRVLVRVNGISMEIDEAMACLDFLWDDARMTSRIVDACLLREALEDQPSEPTQGELQEAMDAFRRARGLLTTAATLEWMTRHCVSHQQLEELVAGEAAVALLRKQTVEGEVTAYFDSHQSHLDSVRIARLVFHSCADAHRAAEEVRSGASFYETAERAVSDGRVNSSPNFFTVVCRDELPLPIANSMSSTPAGTTLGPFQWDGGHAVIRILAVEQAVLDTRTEERIERRLFARWLEERRQAARVEWFSGNASRTSDGHDKGTR